MNIKSIPSLWLISTLLIWNQLVIAGENRWTQFGPSGGSVADIAVNPVDSNIIYAATTGGLYKSSSQGAEWTRMSEGIFSGYEATGIVVVHPDDPNVVTTASSRMFRSEDAGANWSHLSGFRTVHGTVQQIVFDPIDPAVVYAATTLTCIAKSTDGGLSWATVNEGIESPPRCYDIAVDPDAPDTIYASNNAGVYKSVDGADSWQLYDDGIPTQFQLGYLALVPVEGELPELYVTNSFGTEVSLLKSVDGGETWTPSNNGLPDGGARYLVWDSANNLFYVLTPDGPYTSNDGSNWASAGVGHPKNPNSGSLTLDPANPSTLYSTNSMGIFRSTNAAASWTKSITGILASTATEIEFDPALPGTMYAGTTSGEVFKSTNNGQEWTASLIDPALNVGQVADLVVHPAVPDMVFTLGFGTSGLLRTTDGGTTWDQVGLGLGGGPNSLSIDPFSVEPVAESRIYVGGLNNAIHVSLDSGETFTFEDVFDTARNAYEISFDPSDPMRLYAALSNEGVARSDDGGVSWDIINGDIIIEGGTAYFDIDVSSSNPDLVLLRGNRYLYRSIDGGDNWAQIELSDSPQTLSIHPTNDRIFLGAGDGVLISKDDGISFKSISHGLPEFFNSFVYDIEIDRADTRRVVASIGQIALWEMTITEPLLTANNIAPEIVEAGDTLTIDLEVNIAPNSEVTFGLTADNDQCTVAPPEVVFSADTTTQQIEIRAEDDLLLDGTQSCIVDIAPANSDDGIWDAYDPLDIDVTVIDSTEARLAVNSGSAITVVEYGSTRSVQLALTSIPAASVTIRLTSTDEGEGLVNPSEITFADNTTAVLIQTVTITGVDDDKLDGPTPFDIQLTVESADPVYDGLTVSAINAVNLDDEEVLFFGDFE